LPQLFGDLGAARRFTVAAMCFVPTTAHGSGSLGASAGAYHRLVAMHTSNSAGAGPRAAGLGLGDVAITVPGRADLDALAARLGAIGLPLADDGRCVTVDDPWGTQVTVSVPGTTVEQLLERPTA